MPHLANVWRQFERSPLNAETVYYAASGIAHTVPQRLKICIYGAGLGKEYAPLEDPEWAVWALNLVAPIDTHGRLRADVWWDIHQRVAQTEDDMRWIAECPFKIYVPPDLEGSSPNAIAYPLEIIELAFGISYWACTFAYQIALAIHMGATDIGLYGVELAFGTNRERTVEWANVAYWIGRAVERGITIHTPESTTLRCHPGRYGFEYTRELDAVRRYTDDMDQVDIVRRRLKDASGMGG
jgi:hypothetical protein